MLWALAFLILTPWQVRNEGADAEKPFTEWTFDEAVKILNDSPWGKQTTFTRVLGGVGSGISGEKEIFSTFYTRLLSARPIREAFARILQISHGYDGLSDQDKVRFDALLQPGLELNPDRWIVVAVNFRSNNPEEEKRIERFLKTESADTLKRRAFLSTESHPRVELAAYFAPAGDGIGAKFIFPRYLSGEPVVSAKDRTFIFELDVFGSPDLSASFSLEEMRVRGRADL